MRFAALLFCSALFIVAGIAHVVAPARFIQIVPAHFPQAPALVLISGLVELSCGAALLVRQARRLSGLTLMVLLVAVFPANVNMAVNQITFGIIPVPVLWLRLQAALILLVWWATQQPAADDDPVTSATSGDTT